MKRIFFEIFFYFFKYFFLCYNMLNFQIKNFSGHKKWISKWISKCGKKGYKPAFSGRAKSGIIL
jgi:hypothetical protein